MVRFWILDFRLMISVRYFSALAFLAEIVVSKSKVLAEISLLKSKFLVVSSLFAVSSVAMAHVRSVFWIFRVSVSSQSLMYSDNFPFISSRFNCK